MTKPLWNDGDEWTFERIERIAEVCQNIAADEMGYNMYRNSFEIITAEQMIDAYTSIGMPMHYNHWSFGKHYSQEWGQYKSGSSGLAYELVVNTDPCINYLMENNSITVQAAVIAHAACVSGDTEYLSPLGWRKMTDYDGGLVAQYHENGNASYATPSRYIVQEAKNDLIHVSSSSIDQLITEDHTVVFRNGYGAFVKITGAELERRQAEKTRGFNGQIPTGFNLTHENSMPLTDDEICLHIAIKADGALQKKISSGHFNCVEHQRVRFHLKKQRKIDRLCALLGRMQIEHEVRPSYEGRVFIVFNIPETIEKRYTSEWYAASPKQLELIGDEIRYWDGSIDHSRFSSEYKEDVEYIQYVWASTGHHTRLSYGTRCWEVDRAACSSRSLSRHGHDGRQGPQPFERVPSPDGKVYCFTVPSGMFITRRNDRISVTGNCGHNAFFKNNYLFKTWTDASSIVDYMIFAKEYVAKIEQQEGREKVERFLDSCHALQNHGVNRYKRPTKLSMLKEKERQREREAYLQTRVDEFYRILPTKAVEEEIIDENFPPQPEENVLYFCEKYSPSLKPWQRELIRIVRKIAQYFYPQGQTKVANEGFATWTHYTIMNKLHERGLTTDGAHLEFLQMHAGVIFQPAYNDRRYSGLNPYKLGFEILRDVERMCLSSTDEDRRWFPDLEGSDPVEVIKDIVANYRDESFIRQFLSPRLTRKMGLFHLHDDRSNEEFFEVGAIQDEKGFDTVRTLLADQHERELLLPQIEVVRVDPDSRALYLVHRMVRDRKLQDPQTMLNHVSRLWGHSVYLYDEHGAEIGSA